jgi:hypothetical protein
MTPPNLKIRFRTMGRPHPPTMISFCTAMRTRPASLKTYLAKPKALYGPNKKGKRGPRLAVVRMRFPRKSLENTPRSLGRKLRIKFSNQNFWKTPKYGLYRGSHWEGPLIWKCRRKNPGPERIICNLIVKRFIYCSHCIYM